MISIDIENNFYLIIVPCKRRQKNELTDQIVYNFDNQLPKKNYIVCLNYSLSNSQIHN